MLTQFWDKISHFGTKGLESEVDVKNVIVANRISFILSILNAIFILAVYLTIGYSNSIPFLVFGETCYISIFILLSLGFHKVGRVSLSAYVTLATIVFAIGIIKGREVFMPYIYYEIKVLLLSAVVLPLLIFSFRDKLMLGATLGLNFFGLLFFDIILNAFNIGYYQNGGDDPGYTLAHVVFVMSHFFISLSILFLKNISAKYERKNDSLIQKLSLLNEELTSQNDQLTHLNVQVEQRNEEILAQSEELNKANKKIQEQSELLKDKNILLESEVSQKNEELTQTNVQLKKRNEELEQFSFAVSHNLRSPLTSLMGLVKLFKEDKDNREAIIDHINSSVVAMDDIVHGLGRVLSIKNKDEQIWQPVNIEAAISQIWELASNEKEDVELELNLEVESITTIKAYFDSIFFNLISNAIKYRSQDRQSKIQVSSTKTENGLKLTVSDNGLGIDLEKHGNDVFKMYKRFHEGIMGNGIGLYLVKEQIESLGGSIDVESQLNKGTTFTVTLPTQ